MWCNSITAYHSIITILGRLFLLAGYKSQQGIQATTAQSTSTWAKQVETKINASVASSLGHFTLLCPIGTSFIFARYHTQTSIYFGEQYIKNCFKLLMIAKKCISVNWGTFMKFITKFMGNTPMFQINVDFF